MTRRRQGLGLMAVGVVLALGVPIGFVGIADAQEATEQASPFSGFGLRAAGEAFNAFYDDPEQVAHPIGQMAIPETIATLATGPTGTGFAALGWPGPLLGNLSGVIQATGQEGREELNYPVRAEAFAPQGPAEDRNEDVPGAVLHATATTSKTTGTGSAENVGDPANVFMGSASSNAVAALQGGLAVGEATGEVSNFSLGVLKIDSVTSRAKVTTNGTEGKGEGGTVASGVTVAEQPATIDERGLTIGDSTSPSPADAIANQVAREALAQSGIKVGMTRSFEEKDGGKVSYTAPSVIIGWEQDGRQFTFVLGGSMAEANATLADPDALAEEILDVPIADVPSDVGGITPVDTGDAGPVELTAPDGSASPSVDSDDGGGGVVGLASDPVGLYTGLPVALLVGALAGAGMFAAGMRRLADDVFGATPGTACPLLDRKGPT